MKGANAADPVSVRLGPTAAIGSALARQMFVRKNAQWQGQNMVDDDLGCAILGVEKSDHWQT
jgi:hypothetical protein